MRVTLLFRICVMSVRHSIAQALEHSLGMLVVTDNTGIVAYANEGSERRTGYSVAETIGKKPGHLWGGRMSRTFYDALWKELGRLRPVVADIENTRKDGRIYGERIHIAPIIGLDTHKRLFIAAQPFHLEGEGAMERFGADFQQVFGVGHQMSETRFLAWVDRWFLGGKETIGLHRVPERLAVNFIEAELLDPVRERFAAREEDRLLVVAAQADVRAFHSLYVKYEPRIKHYFIRHLGSSCDTVDDLTQETFYRALIHLPRFTATNASYGTYLLRVAHNLLVNHYRKKQVIALFDPTCEEAVHAPFPLLSWSERVLDSPALRESERQILSMKYQEGFSVREIAVILFLSENAVKLRLSRARRRLRGLFSGA